MMMFLLSLLVLLSSVYSTPLIFRCNNLCVGYTGNGRCEDGATGSIASNCIYGSDCEDCGVRPPYTRGPTNEKTRAPTPYNPFGSHSPTDDNSATLTNKPTFSPSLRTAEPTTVSPTTTSPTTSSPTSISPTSQPTSHSPTTSSPTPLAAATNSPTHKTKNPTSTKPTTSSPTTPEPTQFPTSNSPTASPTGSGVCASKITKDDCCKDGGCPESGCKWKNDLCIPSAKQRKTKTPSVSPITASPTSGGGSVLDCTTFVTKQDCCPKNSAGKLGCQYHGCRWDGGLCSSAEKTKTPTFSPTPKTTSSPTSTSAPVTPSGCFVTLSKFDCCPKNSANSLGCQYHGCRWTNSGVCAEDSEARTKKPTSSPVPRPTKQSKTNASPTVAPIVVEVTATPFTTTSSPGIIDCGSALTKEACCPKAAAAALGCEYHGCKWTSFFTCVADKTVG